ncbi:hypothetical protein [Mesobacillus harenae]|uniref:hypothetical protein n=1 Tax=Mesobacillus harenae TaxID=2213203 RepID=UPI0015812DAA|nr:hypothetical protein [Mesobacillus harenae]
MNTIKKGADHKARTFFKSERRTLLEEEYLNGMNRPKHMSSIQYELAYRQLSISSFTGHLAYVFEVTAESSNLTSPF